MSTIEFTSVGHEERSSSTRALAWPLGASLLGRLPIAALGLTILLHVRALGGSYALAGLVSAALGVGLAVGGPLLGRRADIRGAMPVLAASTAASVLALLALALVPHGTPAPVLLTLGMVIGLVHPPVGGIVRSAWPRMLTPESAARVYAVESSTLELTYIAGPGLIGGFLAAHSTRLALIVCVLLLCLGASALLSNRRLRRATGPRTGRPGSLFGALASPGIIVLTVAFAGFGASMGMVEVAVAATAGSRHAGQAGVLLSVWSLGSLFGAALLARGALRHGDPRRRLVVLAALAGVLHGGIALLAPAGPAGVGVGLLLAGAMIAPAFATAYGMVGRIAPPGTTTEAFSWLATGISIGLAFGAAVSGALADGPGTGFAFAASGVTPLLAAWLLSRRREDLCPRALAA